MFKVKIVLLIFILTLNLHSKIINIEDDNLSSIANDDVKFALEMGAKTDFWSPGLAGNVIDYKTEGLFLGYAKLKLKLYDNDVFSIEKYNTFDNSKEQNDLLERYKDDKEDETYIDGVRVSLQIAKIINYLFDTKWLNGLNYEYNTRNFIGNATLKQNSAYWYGNINGGIINQDFVLLETGDRLSFKTKFTSHKLFYKLEDILQHIEGSSLSFGVFDEEWSKPTFIGDTALRGELPVIFDANYYSKGISTAIGIDENNYNLKIYLDVGLDNEMSIIQKENKSKNINKNIDVYMLGLTSNYKFSNIYSTNLFTTDMILGAEMQYNKIVQEGNIELDTETLYAIHAGIEIIF